MKHSARYTFGAALAVAFAALLMVVMSPDKATPPAPTPTETLKPVVKAPAPVAPVAQAPVTACIPKPIFAADPRPARLKFCAPIWPKRLCAYSRLALR